jgi:hypothetical protein
MMKPSMRMRTAALMERRAKAKARLKVRSESWISE